MADAADSKSVVRKDVWVRLPPRARCSASTHIGCHRHLLGLCGSCNLYTLRVASFFLERRLAQLGNRLRVAREKLLVAEEQCSAMEEETNDQELRSLVAETPDASYEFRQAKAHSDALRKYCEELRGSIQELQVRQDELLDKLSKNHRQG